MALEILKLISLKSRFVLIQISSFDKYKEFSGTKLQSETTSFKYVTFIILSLESVINIS